MTVPHRIQTQGIATTFISRIVIVAVTFTFIPGKIGANYVVMTWKINPWEGNGLHIICQGYLNLAILD